MLAERSQAYACNPAHRRRPAFEMPALFSLVATRSFCKFVLRRRNTRIGNLLGLALQNGDKFVLTGD